MSEPTITAPADPAASVAERGAPVTRPLLIALIGLALLVAAAIVWAIFGRAPQTVTGYGYLVPSGGFTEVGTTVSGVVDSVAVEPGQRVRAGEELVRVNVSSDSGGAEVESLQSPVDGVVIEVVALPGRVTVPGDPMLYLQPADAPLEIAAFVLADSSGPIRVGMEAGVVPADAPRPAEYGVLIGRVDSVSPTPVTASRIRYLVGGNETLVEYFLSEGPVIEVGIDLQEDPTTPSGYAWTIGDGPDVQISSGALSEVFIVTQDSPVIGWFAQ